MTTETDHTILEVRRQLLTGAADAHGYPRQTPEQREPVCWCGHGASAHYGDMGEDACGEADCSCNKFGAST